jgi:hypothetical protein
MLGSSVDGMLARMLYRKWDPDPALLMMENCGHTELWVWSGQQGIGLRFLFIAASRVVRGV